MPRVICTTIMSLSLVLAACTAAPSKSGSSAATSADYVRVGAQFDNTSSDIIITPGNDAVDPEDLTLSLHFGLAVVAHKGDGPERAAGLSLRGAGDRPEKAYVIDGLAQQADAIESAFSIIARQYPSRRDVRAYLLNGPGKTYVAQIEFVAEGGAKRIYVDLTAWADAIKAGA